MKWDRLHCRRPQGDKRPTPSGHQPELLIVPVGLPFFIDLLRGWVRLVTRNEEPKIESQSPGRALGCNPLSAPFLYPSLKVSVDPPFVRV